jgi:hypothetical protein
MTRALAVALLCVLSSPALAHPGHISDQGSGHSHLAAAAIVFGLLVAGASYALAMLLRRLKGSSRVRRI